MSGGWNPPAINPPPPPPPPRPLPSVESPMVFAAWKQYQGKKEAMSEPQQVSAERIERSNDRNGISASCEISRIKTEESTDQTIWVTVDLADQDLTNIEGDIRDRIAELLNQCIRGISNP